MTEQERLASIETNVTWLVQEWKDAKHTGFPRCEARHIQIENLSKSVGTFKKILVSACAIPVIGTVVGKFI